MRSTVLMGFLVFILATVSIAGVAVSLTHSQVFVPVVTADVFGLVGYWNSIYNNASGGTYRIEDTYTSQCNGTSYGAAPPQQQPLVVVPNTQTVQLTGTPENGGNWTYQADKVVYGAGFATAKLGASITATYKQVITRFRSWHNGNLLQDIPMSATHTVVRTLRADAQRPQDSFSLPRGTPPNWTMLVSGAGSLGLDETMKFELTMQSEIDWIGTNPNPGDSFTIGGYLDMDVKQSGSYTP